MKEHAFRISVVVIGSERESGIEGLSVEAWKAGRPGDTMLACGITGQRGMLSLALSTEDLRGPDNTTSALYLKVRDGDANLIHVTEAQAGPFCPERPLHYRLTLDETVLAKNVSHPSRWKQPKGTLVSAQKLAEIKQAVALFVRPGDPGNADLLQALDSILPPIHHFGDILGDAWLVLQGDTAAARRFRDALDAIDMLWLSAPDQTPRSQDLAELFTSEGQARLAELAATAPRLTPEERGVPLEHEAILAMAAFHANAGEPANARRHAGIIFDQLRRYDFLTTLHRSASAALAGSKGGRTTFWGILCLLSSPTGMPRLLGPGFPKPPVPHPPAPGPVGPKPTMPVRFPFVWPPVRVWDKCVLIAVKTLSLAQNHYKVTNVSPLRACPGESITITGTGFGTVPGKVRFRQRGTPEGSPRIEVSPDTWADTQITVVVPDNTGCGIELGIPIPEWKACDKILQLFKQGEFTVNFGGGSPDIRRFTVNSDAQSTSFKFGEPLAIAWDVGAADGVCVEIRDHNKNLLGAHDPASPAGTWNFTATNFTSPIRLDIKLTASGKCNPSMAERVIHAISCCDPFQQIAEDLGETNCTSATTTPAAPDKRVLLFARNHIYVFGQAGVYDGNATTQSPAAAAVQWKNSDLVSYRLKQIGDLFPKMNKILDDAGADVYVHDDGYDIRAVTQDKILAQLNDFGAEGTTLDLVTDLINADSRYVHVLWLWTSSTARIAVGNVRAPGRYIAIGDNPMGGDTMNDVTFAHEFVHALGVFTHVYGDPTNLMNDEAKGTTLNPQQLAAIRSSLNDQADQVYKLSCDK